MTNNNHVCEICGDKLNAKEIKAKLEAECDAWCCAECYDASEDLFDDNP